MNKKEIHTVVFNGTSAYVTSIDEAIKYELLMLGNFDDLDEAQMFCDEKNNSIIDKL